MRSIALSLIAFVLSGGIAAAEVNPYLPAYPFKTAKITYTHKDGRTETLYLKGHNEHSSDEPSGNYHLATPDVEYNVLADEQKLIAFVPPARMFRNFYATLSDADKATVQANLAKAGPHIKLYGETGAVKLPDRTIAGRPAECYDFGIHNALLDMPMEKCFWYGILLDYRSDYVSYAATKIELDVPLDDALFTAPSGYAVDKNEEVGGAITERYATIFTNLKDPAFTVEEGLDTRYWAEEDAPDKELMKILMK